MSQRDSGYERKERDLYETPEWVTEALLPHIKDRLAPNWPRQIWEPACGSCKMVAALAPLGRVDFTDIDSGIDFLTVNEANTYDAIITNPPYALADRFVEHAINLMHPNGLVAMLLRCDWDSAKTRARFFAGNIIFAKKLVLTKRIKWFEGTGGSPSFNHAWYIWDWEHTGAPTIAYAP